jgi:hypothetical protein
VTSDQAFSIIIQQNEIIITLLARLVWTPEKLAAIVVAGKRNPDAYLSVYNALDGIKTGKQLATIAGVTQQAVSGVIQTWQDEGIVLNVGTESLPKYRRLMRIPEKRKSKERSAAATSAAISKDTPQMKENQSTNGNIGE